MHGGSGHNGSAVYRGRDRRQRSRGPARTIRRTEVLGFVALVLTFGALLPLGLRSLPTSAAVHAQASIRSVWAVLFLCAGVLHLACHRITGETRTGLRGVAAVYLGLVMATTAAVTPMLYRNVSEEALSPLARTIAVVGCLLLLTRASNATAVDTRSHPIRLLGAAFACGWGFMLLMIVLTGQHRSVDAGARGWFGIECALAFGWMLAGVAAARRAAGHRRVGHRDVSLMWMAVALFLMGVADVARALAFDAHPQWQYVATGLQLVAGVVVVTNAGADLASLVSAQSARVLVLSRTVRDAEQHLTEDEQTSRLRRHDARSVLASLQAASLVLDRYDRTLDADSRAQLLGSFGHELRQLEGVIDARTAAPLEEFRLDEALAPTLASPDVELVSTPPPLVVRGRADELAALVESTVTLLGRACADAKVLVDVDRSTSGVQIICTAAGGPRTSSPIADDDTSARNLRIQLAKRLMRAQGGDVVVNTRWDGTTSVVFWLQRVRTAPAAAVAATVMAL